jgi:hypothetical protein
MDEPAGQIERYLLGRLSPDEQASVEARLFESEDLLPLVQDAEEHLIDRYLENDLSPEDRIAFEQHFAASRWRQEQVAFRRTLTTALRRQSLRPGVPDAPTPSNARSRPSTRLLSRLPTTALPLPRRPAAWAMCTLVAASIVLGLGWLARQKTTSTGVAILAPPASRPPAGESSDSPPLEGPRRGTPGSVSSPSTLGRPSLILRPGLLRSRGRLPRMAVPKGTEVRLDAELDGHATSRQGSARLCNVVGDTLWRGTASIVAGGRRATVIVPATLFQPGDYVLFIATGDQEETEAPTYVFRVVP